MTYPRIALVTGANRGIGLEIARRLAQANIHVLMAARSLQAGAVVAEKLTGDGLAVEAIELDVTQSVSITAAVEDVVARHGRIDILVNNAGITDGDTHPSTLDLAVAEAVLETNLMGAWRLAQEVVPYMRAAGYGRIVNVTSGLASLAGMTRDSEPAYRISKAALHALTRVLAAELSGTGILVNAGSPGWCRTRMGGPNAPRSAEEGADTPVWLATLPDDGPTGGYYEDRTLHPW